MGKGGDDVIETGAGNDTIWSVTSPDGCGAATPSGEGPAAVRPVA